MNTANINVRVDASLKKEAEDLFNDLGLNMSSAITLFLKSAVLHDGLPFHITRTLPNIQTRNALAEYEDMRKNPQNYKHYQNFAEIEKDIDNEP